jgi:iron complex transport system ATP-binding protein
MSAASRVLLRIEALQLSRGGRIVVALDRLELASGHLATLIGPNGSGKTTLLRTIAGLDAANEGARVEIEGRELRGLPAPERARRVAYVGADLLTDFPVPVEEAVSLGGLSHPAVSAPELRERARAAMDECRITGLARRELRSLSGGERQLVALARALVQDSPLLLLDESLSKMDLNHQTVAGGILRRLTASGKSVILVAHDLALATTWAEEALLLSAGRLLARGPVAETVTEANLRLLYPGWEPRTGPAQK